MAVDKPPMPPPITPTFSFRQPVATAEGILPGNISCNEETGMIVVSKRDKKVGSFKESVTKRPMSVYHKKSWIL